MAKKRKRYVLLDPATDEMFSQFCAKTRRDEPHTLRTIVELFFADGVEAANERFNRGLWAVVNGTPEQRAAYVVSGERPKPRIPK